ncbi:hypothetical protein VTN31DRAFT_2032 [Thermomyces dupontii]|uniref:uncharacterized protein n=1 Tax=Talaromyces thermophilus TaxID=28565 RepID=UPI003742C8D4
MEKWATRHKLAAMKIYCMTQYMYSIGEGALMAQRPLPQVYATDTNERRDIKPVPNSWSRQEDDEKTSDQLPRVDRDEWIVDTGTSAHMTWDKRVFSSFKPLATARKVQTGGARLPIEGIGTVRIADAVNNTIRSGTSSTFQIRLGVNLISVGTLCDKGIKLSMPENGTNLHFYRDGRLLFKAARRG